MLSAITQQGRLRSRIESAFAEFLRREDAERNQASIVAFARQAAPQRDAASGAPDESEIIALLGGRTAESYQRELMQLLVSPSL